MQLMDKTGLIADRVPFGTDLEDERRETQATIAPELGFQQVIRVLRRRRKLIFTIAGVGTMLAGIAGLLISPKYTATAQVVQVQGANPLSPEALQQAVDTQVTMLTSPYHLRHVLDSFRNDPRLHVLAPQAKADPASTPKPAQSDTNEVQPLGLSELKRRLEVWIGPIFKHRRKDAGLSFDDLQRRLQVLQERRSRIINVTFQWPSPELAAAIVNRIVELYVQSNAEQQRAYTAGELARLEQRIATIKGNIEWTTAALHKAIPQHADVDRSADGDERQTAPDPHELERRIAASAQLYASLLQRQKEIREQDELVNPDVSILSLASPPPWPSSPNPILFMLPALIVSLICGGFIVLVQERLDRGVRSENEVNDALGLSCIGLVPRIPRGRLTDPGSYLRVEPFSPHAGALRSAVATLRLGEPGHAKVVLIISSITGEGKTTLSRSLAAYVALLGRRALLISVDLRKGMRVDDVDEAGERRFVGLQNRSLVESIRQVPEAGFDYLQMPGYRLDPMSATEQVAGLIRQCRERYDCMIIDGPPVLTAVEARLLPAIADKLLFVVKWGSTRREVAKYALGLLRNFGCIKKERGDFATAIVTQVDLKRHAQYGYGDASEFAAGAAGAPRSGIRKGLLARSYSLSRGHQR